MIPINTKSALQAIRRFPKKNSQSYKHTYFLTILQVISTGLRKKVSGNGKGPVLFAAQWTVQSFWDFTCGNESISVITFI